MPVCLYIVFTERRDTAYRWLRSRTCNLNKLFYLLFRLGSTNIRDKAVGLKVRFAQTHRHCSRHNTTLYLTHQHISVSASKSFLQTVNTHSQNRKTLSKLFIKGLLWRVYGLSFVRGQRGTSILMT
jgi:hypothetical protein